MLQWLHKYTTSCHQCQYQHVRWQCSGRGLAPGKACERSYCQRCVDTKYMGLGLRGIMEVRAAGVAGVAGVMGGAGGAGGW